jgi:hypothetical protein
LRRSIFYSVAVVAVIGCSSTDDSNVSCGPGTVPQDGTCIPADSGVGDTSVRDTGGDSGTDSAKPDVTIDAGSDLGTDVKDAPDSTTDVTDAPESPPDVADAADTPTDSAEGGGADTTPVTLPWTRHFGGTGNDQPLGVLANAAGETIVHGFSQSSSLDLGKGAITLPTGTPGVLAKLDPSGTTLWTKVYSAEGGGEIDATTQAIDSAGNVFVGGGLYHTTGVDFGDAKLTASCGGSGAPGCAYVAKIDGAGKYVWGKYFPASVANVDGLATDGTDVVLTGHFAGAIDFGLGALTGVGSDYEIFLAKLGPTGTPSWAKRFNGGSGGSDGQAVATDVAGNVFMTGLFSGTIDFGGGPLVATGSTDIFLAKFDKSGAHLWSKRFGDASAQGGFSVATDSAGSVYLEGDLRGSADFGGGSVTAASTTLSDMFVAKFTPGGTHVWSKGFGGVGGAGGSAVVAKDGVLLTGAFVDTIDFGSGPMTGASGKREMFIAKLTLAGAAVWSHHFGGASSKYAGGTSLAVDSFGNASVLGGFDGTTDFDGGLFGLTVYTSAASQELFLGRFTP